MNQVQVLERLRELDEDIYKEWLADPVTIVFFEYHRLKRENLKEQWAMGYMSDGMSTAMVIKNAGATGHCNAIQEMLGLTFEDMKGGFTDE